MRLEDQVNKGLSQAVQELLTRRSVDFLVIILINFGNLCPRPNYYWTLYREIQIVLQIPALRTSNIRFKPPRKLLTAILHAFKFYNGKDHLSLQICEVGPIGRAFGERNRKLSRPGIYIHQRPTCKDKHRGCRYQARAKEVWGQRYPEIRKQAAAFHLYIAMKSWKERKLRLAKQNAALILYQRYQKIKERRAQLKEAARVLCQRYQKVKERRKAAALIIYQRYQKVKEVNAYRKSLEGAAISSIQTLFQKKRLLVPLKKYLLLLSIMMTDGVPLYLELQAVYEEFLHLDEKATQHGLKQKYGEHLDGLYDEINYPWDTLFQAKNFAVFDLDEAKLRQRLAEGMTMVTSVRQGLQDLSSEMFPPSMIS
ncbi:hypothetical protein BDZ91DRAFT_305418 [Kalaharituber pfeilii]|nr:hypothetical protein BDZ91DRAFT_305418 [Kalaharituber pfeilii]